MAALNIIWQCPNCGKLNLWKDETCWNCFFDFDKQLAMMAVAEQLELHTNIITKDGIFSFKKIKRE